MLILSRKVKEEIVIDDAIVVKVLSIRREKVKLGISAPKRVAIARREIAHLPAKPENQGKACRRTSLRAPPKTASTK